MEKLKRNRSSNWEEEEKFLLKSLIKEKISLIECKNADTNTNRSKKDAWKMIHESFNALNKKQRDLNQLMTQWRNMKNSAKIKHSEYRRAQHATGGGPPPPSPGMEDIEIMSLIPNEFIVDSNPFDSDGLSLPNQIQIEKIDVDKMDAETATLHTEICPSPSPTIREHVPDQEYTLTKTPCESKKLKKISIKNKLFKKVKKDTNDNENKLFLIAKEAREKAMEYSLAEHNLRMEIMSIEKKYWQSKLENENNSSVFRV